MCSRAPWLLQLQVFLIVFFCWSLQLQVAASYYLAREWKCCHVFCPDLVATVHAQHASSHCFGRACYSNPV
jgi:hypothetical protein